MPRSTVKTGALPWWRPAAMSNASLTARSLETEWRGFVWMNPPFGPRNGIAPWLAKFFKHANGVALVPDRTSAPWFQRWVPCASLLLFVSPKIKFIGGNGQSNRSPAQGTVLLAAGKRGVAALVRAESRSLGMLAQPCSF